MFLIRSKQSLVQFSLFLLLLSIAHYLPAHAGGSLRYGVSVAQHDYTSALKMGFDWMATYDIPTTRLPINIMYRVPVNRWSIDPNDPYGRWRYTNWLYDQLLPVADRIDAYEIGNEVNLYINGWEGAPDAQKYVEMLCLTSQVIKSFDPTATIISAGLSPVGRIDGSWNGHKGHNYTSQDEREFLREMIDAGGMNCTDAVGYHPNGFSANFDAEPDVDGGTPETNCSNGFCFRGIEKIHEMLIEKGFANKGIWATEVGWIAEPENPECLKDGSWTGRQWQKVSKEKQAENLVGAVRYAETNRSWLQGMFIFNLNFDQAAYYGECEQMRSYSVISSPAYQALSALHPEAQSRVNYLPLISNNGEKNAGGAILDTLRANGNYNILIEMLTIANLSSMFDNNENLTLFAPTDAAFESLPQAALDQLKQNPQTQLRQILLFHILQGRFTADMLQNGMKIQTLQGNAVKFDIRNGYFKVQDSNITPVQIQPAIGAIHSIDKVMLPPAS